MRSADRAFCLRTWYSRLRLRKCFNHWWPTIQTSKHIRLFAALTIILGRVYMSISSCWSIYPRIPFSCSSLRAFIVNACALFDILLFHCFRNCQTGTWYTVAAYIRFEYQQSWIASQTPLMRLSIAEYEEKAILLYNYRLIVTGKYEKYQIEINATLRQ